MFHAAQQIGTYILNQRLGRGGFGEVWLAEKRSQFVTKKVAIKLPLDEQVDFEAIKQEATLWEQASGHANVLPIIDADVCDGQVVIVSEYAEGGSLAGKLKREGTLPVRQTVEMCIGILSGLEYLHSKKIIHRDIKPANILLQGDTPRLADFGISRAMQTTAISSNIVGTDAYMSPESFNGKRNAQTDIWSVGVILYQLLNGNLPFPQENPSERMFAILTKEFAPLPDSVPQNIKTVVARALAKDTAIRYKTAAEMRADLQKVLRGEPTIFAQPIPATTEEETIVRPSVPPVPQPLIQPPKKQSYALYFGIAAFLGLSVLIGALALLFSLNNSSRETAQVADTRNVNTSRNANLTTTQNTNISNANSISANSNPQTNLNVAPTNANMANMNVNTNANVAPTPSPTPSSASVRLRYVSLGASNCSMMSDTNLILTTQGKTFRAVTGNNGIATFSNVPCGKSAKVTDSSGDLNVNQTLSCNSNSIYLGSFGTYSGARTIRVDEKTANKCFR
ncbi:MAG: protein kinase [Acidobacteria bacterium]|nr:protein kinase [Acidobacteriota bacterium]